jgi:hypothetical protein
VVEWDCVMSVTRIKCRIPKKPSLTKMPPINLPPHRNPHTPGSQLLSGHRDFHDNH